MKAEALQELLEAVAAGQMNPSEAQARLQDAAAISEQALCLDLERERRCGMPEVVYGRGKTLEQCHLALQQLVERHGYALATGICPIWAERLKLLFPEGQYHELAQLWRIGQMPRLETRRQVCVVSAGTSDLRVALEAVETLRFAGVQVNHLADVGVAGLHRLLARVKEIQSHDVIIAVAGMEGTLPGVITGLISKPVIAVPTSVGYGSHLGGMAPLLAMLNACASGMAVVNIDNGFGAAMMAIRMVKA